MKKIAVRGKNSLRSETLVNPGTSRFPAIPPGSVTDAQRAVINAAAERAANLNNPVKIRITEIK